MTFDESNDVRVGDRVIVEGNYFAVAGDYIPESTLTVVDEGVLNHTGWWINHSQVSIGCVKAYPSRFTHVFSDKLTENKLVLSGIGLGIDPTEFNLSCTNAIADVAMSRSTTQDETTELGVYRPNLEDRKVGKVRVELVDDGFPLALREIAKVMTWAQTAKGYKDHDWQNLPNPEQALAAATSRHRTDHIIQRQVGKSEAIDCTDHESDILHKAHEAFGVLAQLELILRGTIR